MAGRDYKQLLEKETNTGKELGQMLIANTATEYAVYRTDSRSFNYAVDPGEIQKRAGLLKAPSDIIAYNNYFYMNTFTKEQFLLMLATEEGYRADWTEYFFRTKGAYDEERLLQAVNGIPVIQITSFYKAGKNEPASLGKLFTENQVQKECKDFAENLLDLRAAIVDDIALFKAFNYMLERMAELHDTPELLKLKVNTAAYMKKIRELNALCKKLQQFITPEAAGTDELKALKKQAISKYFSPLKQADTSLQGPAVNQKEIDSLLKSFYPFKNNHYKIQLINLLYAEKPKGDEEKTPKKRAATRAGAKK